MGHGSKIISFADYDGVGECHTCVGGDTVIFTGTATVERSCDSTFQVTSGFTLTVHLDNSLLPLDASGDPGFGQYDGLIQSWSFTWGEPARNDKVKMTRHDHAKVTHPG